MKKKDIAKYYLVFSTLYSSYAKTLRKHFRGKLTCISIFFTCFLLIFVMEKSLSYFTPFTHEKEIKSTFIIKITVCLLA